MKESSGREGRRKHARLGETRAAGRSFVRRLSLSEEKKGGRTRKNGEGVVGIGFDSGNINHITNNVRVVVRLRTTRYHAP